MIKRDVVQGLDINIHNIKEVWKNPYLKEKLIGSGFVENEEVFTAYKTFSDDMIFCGVEREANRTSQTNKGDTKPS